MPCPLPGPQPWSLASGTCPRPGFSEELRCHTGSAQRGDLSIPLQLVDLGPGHLLCLQGCSTIATTGRSLHSLADLWGQFASSHTSSEILFLLKAEYNYKNQVLWRFVTVFRKEKGRSYDSLPLRPRENLAFFLLLARPGEQPSTLRCAPPVMPGLPATTRRRRRRGRTQPCAHPELRPPASRAGGGDVSTI